MNKPLELRRTPEARLDYFNIFVYVAERNVDAAQNLIDTFDAKLDFLRGMPGAGQPRPDLGNNLRTFPVNSYLLICRKKGEFLELIRVIHGARDTRRAMRNR